MQMVFQDPYGSLNPRHTIGRSIAEPLSLQENQTAEETSKLVGETLEEVGLEASDASKYPHEFSGDNVSGLPLQEPDHPSCHDCGG